MGRVGRQRKLKSVDPFLKKIPNKKDGSDKYDLDPKNEDEDYQVPRKAKELLKLAQISASGQKGVSRKKKKQPNEFTKKPGENRKQFFDRLDQQVGFALNKAMDQTKKLRGRRKDHLKKRDEKIKSKKSKAEQNGTREWKIEAQDPVQFGEVVSQPPSISALPRKGGGKKAKLDLKLTKLIKKDGDDESIDRILKMKRKEMTEKMKRIHKEEREKAIKEYRKLKQRKSVRT